MNCKFGRVEDEKMTYAPNALVIGDGVMLNPTASEYRKQNWLPNEVSEPAPDAGYHVKSQKWATDGEKNYKVYEYEKDNLVVHKYSKFKLESCAFKLGILDQLDAFIDSQEIENEKGQKMKIRRLYETANEFSDDNPYFTKYSKAVQTALGLSDEKMSKILRECETV